MKKISEKSRKFFRKICIFMGASAISMLFAACYGMPMDDYDYDHEDCSYPCCQEEPSSTGDE